MDRCKRFPGLPQLPTIGEAGVPGFAVDNWTGVFVPAGTPREAIARLNAAFTKAVAVADTRAKLLDSFRMQMCGSIERRWMPFQGERA